MTEEKKYLLTMSDIYRTYFLIREIDEGDDDIESDTDEMGDLLKPREYNERTCTMSHRTFAGIDCYKCEDCDDVLYAFHAPNYCPNCGAKVVL